LWNEFWEAAEGDLLPTLVIVQKAFNWLQTLDPNYGKDTSHGDGRFHVPSPANRIDFPSRPRLGAQGTLFQERRALS
jgi:hypothetical protein